MSKGGMVVRSKLKELVAQIERKKSRVVQQQEIANETGLTENTVSRWMKPDPFDRIETKTAVRLCAYVTQNLGRKCEIGDLLFIDYMPTQS